MHTVVVWMSAAEWRIAAVVTCWPVNKWFLCHVSTRYIISDIPTLWRC